MATESYSGFNQRYNMIFGVLICALLTSVLYIILQVYFFFIADIYLVVGNCIGLYFTFKNRKESQSHIKTGLIVGLIGSVLALFLIGFFIWILYYIPALGLNFIHLLDLTLYLLVGFGIMFVFVGLIIGYLFGNKYRKRDTIGNKSPLF